MFTEQGLLEKTESYYNQALLLNRVIYGNVHTNIFECLDALEIIFKEGNFTEAKKLFMEVVSVTEMIEGTNHPLVASGYQHLGDIEHKLSNLSSAMEFYQKGYYCVLFKLSQNVLETHTPKLHSIITI